MPIKERKEKKREKKNLGAPGSVLRSQHWGFFRMVVPASEAFGAGIPLLNSPQPFIYLFFFTYACILVCIVLYMSVYFVSTVYV